MPAWRQRLLAAAIATTVAVAAAVGCARWLGLNRSQRGSGEDLVFREIDTVSIAADMARERGHAKVGTSPRPGSEFEYHVPRDYVERLFGLGAPGDTRRFDPWCWFVAGPDTRQTRDWPEYPGGSYELKTNSMGFADGELAPSPPADQLRILAAGDSHTFGMCSPERAWPNQLEDALSGTWPERSIEVLNTGQVGHAFHQYLGALLKGLEWRPHAFVLLVFEGNDFIETLWYAPLFDQAEAKRIPPRLAKRRTVAQQRMSKAAMGQCYNSLQWFKHFPEDLDLALELGLTTLEQMRDVCTQNGMLFVAAIAPTPCCLPDDEAPEVFAQIEAHLRLSDVACNRHGELVERFVAGAGELGVEVLDLRPRFEASGVPCYWRRDQHLNLEGLGLVAEAFYPAVSAWIAARLEIEPTDR